MTRFATLPAGMIALALAACAPKPPVTVAVPVPCLRADQVPAKPGPLPKPAPVDARDALDLAMISLLEHRGYADTADKLLRACAE